MSEAHRPAKRNPGIVGCYVSRLGVAVSSPCYEIRVSGVLPLEVLLDFDQLTASVEPVETVVHGPLRDQAALNALLARLETFGVEIREIRRRRERRPDGDPNGRR
jgi:hypothetical protein